MHVVIAGCGRVGSDLARSLSEDGHDVTIIDKDEVRLMHLGKAFNGVTVRGQAYDVDVLRHAGIEDADVFLAVTDSDNANLMAVEVAKRVFGVERTVARLYDPAREDSYRALDIRFVTGTSLIAKVIYEQVVDEEFHYHLTFPEGDVEIVEFILNDNATELHVEDLEIRNKLRVAAVRRGSVTHIPKPRFLLKSGDLVVAAAREGIRSRIDRYIKSEEPA